MIKLQRGAVPEYLNGVQIQHEKKLLEEKFYNISRQERLRFDWSLLQPLKNILHSQYNGKCVYCESRIESDRDGEVENFRPREGARGFNSNEYAPGHYWWLAYEWENLLYACQICTQKYKRDYFPLENESFRSRIGAMGDELLSEKPLLIDPASENPEEHLEFQEDGLVIDLSPRGKVTIEILGLNRSSLVEARKFEALQLKARLMQLTEGTEDLSFLVDLVKYVEELLSEHSSFVYSATQRTVFQNWYEENAFVWEDIADRINENSRAKPKAKSVRPKRQLVNDDSSEMENQLNTIKRFSIRKIEIENFKSIAHLELNVKTGNNRTSGESWLLLLGDNGIGKSSILQAITLCLTPRAELEKLELDPDVYLRNGTSDGKIVIHSYESDQPIVLTFDHNGFHSVLEEPPTFILGYGSTRLLPKGKIQPDENRPPYLNIRNLFDYSISLSDPNEWLANVDTSEFNERVAPAFFDILALREKDRLYVNNGKIYIRQFGEDHDLDENSDGYKTITALVSDIMQTLSIEKANYHNSQGIVLIDEIGNHLHPRWRMKIAASLRRAFPNLQFIVTTHEPLCLRGLFHGEVVVLVRDQSLNIKALDSELLPDHTLMRVEQLLTSDLFGLINVLDEETEKTYEEYYALLSKKEQDKTTEDKIKIDQFAAVIAQKEMLGNTPKEQIFYKLIDEIMAKKIREDGFKTKEIIKNETIKDIKDMIVSKNIDWL